MFLSEYCDISRNTCFEEHLRTAPSGLTLVDSRFVSLILEKYQSLSNQSFEHNLVHMPSLNLTLKLSFESRGFACSTLTFTTQKVEAYSPWTPYLILQQNRQLHRCQPLQAWIIFREKQNGRKYSSNSHCTATSDKKSSAIKQLSYCFKFISFFRLKCN